MISYMWTNQNRLFAVFPNLAHKKNSWDWLSQEIFTTGTHQTLFLKRCIRNFWNIKNCTVLLGWATAVNEWQFFSKIYEKFLLTEGQSGAVNDSWNMFR